MKKFSLLVVMLGLFVSSFAQLNTSLVSSFDYEMAVNDVWGYVAEDGTEYALVGIQDGVSVVSLADPSAPEEVGFAPGPSSTWRDMKTWGTHAYTINETGDGLLVMDLAMLPDTMSYYYWSPVIPELDSMQLTTCHNIYIDEFGYAYLAGCNVNDGGPIFLDVFSDPGNPIDVGKSDARYAHDAYARDNILYGSDIYAGSFSITDVSDKSNPVLLATQETPFTFTHNAWLSDDSKTLFTTDERADAPTAAYDISDLDNIRLLDEFRPANTVGLGVIPHNTHVLNDFLITSHYTDGVVIVDASRPSNLVEVGNYDTYLGNDGGFNGCWGAYPFLPSGLVLGSDRESGLFVLEADYVRACYLEGIVRRAGSEELLADVEITIDSENPNFKSTNLEGRFATGQVTSGTFPVVFSKFGFKDKIMEVELVNGVVTEVEVELEAEARFSVSGQVISAADRSPIAGAKLSMASEEIVYQIETDENGSFSLTDLVEDNYEVFVGAWGYLYQNVTINSDNATEAFVFEMEEGYVDDFALDLGWTVESNAATGSWEIGTPIGTGFGGTIVNPDMDVEGDIGSSCFMTGNGGGGAGDDDVDDGETVLISPAMDLFTFENATISYYTWFFNEGGDGNPNDSLDIYLTNGTEQILLESINESRSEWVQSTFELNELDISASENMRIIFTTGDYNPGHLVEAAVDLFSVVDELDTNTNEILAKNTKLEVMPNPFTGATSINISLPSEVNQASFQVYNLLGQLIETQQIGKQATVQLGQNYPAGTYFVSILAEGGFVKTAKLIKK